MKSLKSIFCQISEVPSITQCAVIRSNVLFCRNISKWSRAPFLAIVAIGRFVTGNLIVSERGMYAQLPKILNFQILQNCTTNRTIVFPWNTFWSSALVIWLHNFFFSISFFQEQIIQETSLTHCPIACFIPQELFSVESLLGTYTIRSTKCWSSFFFFLFKQRDTPVFPLFGGIHTLGKQAERINCISSACICQLHTNMPCCSDSSPVNCKTFVESRWQLKGTTRKCE